MSNCVSFDFSRVSDESLNSRLKETTIEVKALKRRLNGPPLKCDGCGVMEGNRDRLRLGHDARGEEIVICSECGCVLFQRGVSTAPFGKVLRSDLERAENSFLAMKEELAGRAKRAIAQAEHERKLESSGFLDRFKRTESGNGADPEPLSAKTETNDLSDGEALN